MRNNSPLIRDECPFDTVQIFDERVGFRRQGGLCGTAAEEACDRGDGRRPERGPDPPLRPGADAGGGEQGLDDIERHTRTQAHRDRRSHRQHEHHLRHRDHRVEADDRGLGQDEQQGSGEPPADEMEVPWLPRGRDRARCDERDEQDGAHEQERRVPDGIR